MGYYKIGKTTNLGMRLKTYDTHNPIWNLVYTVNCDCEQYLLDKYSDKRLKFDWFSLNQDDVDWIKKNTETLTQNRKGIYISEAAKREACIKETKQKEDDIKLDEYIEQNPNQFKN